jgi:hypothetical protein
MMIDRSERRRAADADGAAATWRVGLVAGLASEERTYRPSPLAGTDAATAIDDKRGPGHGVPWLADQGTFYGLR